MAWYNEQRRTIRLGRSQRGGKTTRPPSDTLPPDALAAELMELQGRKEFKNLYEPRASGLYQACVRKLVLATVHKKKEVSVDSFPQRLIFGIGTAVHTWAQNSDEVFGDRRRGWWRCSACRKILYFGAPPTRKCPHCGASPGAIEYYEHPLKIVDPVIVSGHPDMFLQYRGVPLRVVELKTMAKDQFATLKAPLAEHDWQVQTYMWLCSLDPSLPIDTDTERAYICYISKGSAGGVFPSKAFVIKRNPHLLSRIQEKLHLYKRGIKEYPNWLPPPDAACLRGEFKNYKANTCVVREECLACHREAV